MEIIQTVVLIIGGGLAGLRVGIGARRRGHDVLILSLVPPKRSHSAAAQGGMGQWAWPRIAAVYVLVVTPGLVAFTFAQRLFMDIPGLVG